MDSLDHLNGPPDKTSMRSPVGYVDHSNGTLDKTGMRSPIGGFS